jgi:hypothetical protein
MQSLFDDPELARQMGSRSFQRIQEYTPEKCAAGIVQALAFVSGEPA